MSMTSDDYSHMKISVGSIPAQLSNNITKLTQLEDVLITNLMDGQVLKWNASISKWVNVDPALISSSEVAGTAIRSGDGQTTIFVIPHSFGSTPTTVFIEGTSEDADDEFSWTVDETNIVVTFTFPPPQGTSNLKFYYRVS